MPAAPGARRWRRNSFTVTHWCMTICRPWTIPTCAVANPPSIKPTARRRRFLRALAFEVLADPETHEDPRVRIELVSNLASASGMNGMVGGQMLDMIGEK